MRFLEFATVAQEINRIVAFGILGLIALGILVLIGLFIASIIAQKRYESDTLPSLAELNPDEEEDNRDSDDDVPSVFLFEDEDISDETSSTVENSAEELLKDVRAVEATTSKGSSFNPFGRKKS